MLYPNTLEEIANNINTGVEYEIALFYKLSSKPDQKSILETINTRIDKDKITSIIEQTDIQPILDALYQNGLLLHDVTFETQNDEVGPSDIVMLVADNDNNKKQIGISVKFNNSCTCNCSYHYFLTESDKRTLINELPKFATKHIESMNSLFGSPSFWFRNRKCRFSGITNEFIDLIRDKIIENWQHKSNEEKINVLATMLQTYSPIKYWVYTYKNSSIELDINPYHISNKDVNRVVLAKSAGQFIKFLLDEEVFAQMQVKFNNGILERVRNSRQIPDIVVDGIAMKYGDAFGSWNFSLRK